MGKKLKIGVLGCSEFAGRAMLPNIQVSDNCELYAVASRILDKARTFSSRFSCIAYGSYHELLDDKNISAAYLPLPTALHEEWVIKSLEAGKHVLCEKSFAIDAMSAQRMINCAKANGLLILENILFPRHSLTQAVIKMINSGIIGDLRLIKAIFTVPGFQEDNIRYSKALGGGALYDLGVYTIKLSRIFLGDDLKVSSGILHYDNNNSVDKYGAATFINKLGQVAQVYFGFDHHYQNSWEFIGTSGRLYVERAFTAKPGVVPLILVEDKNGKREHRLDEDNIYSNMWNYFAEETIKPENYINHYNELLSQCSLIDKLREKAS